MSYLSNALGVVLENRNITQTALCMMTDISQSQLSRYLSGENAPSLAAVEQICKALPESDRAEIARAWLYDQLPPSARNLLTISTISPPLPGAQWTVREPDPDFAMPKDLRKAFDFLEKLSVTNPYVRSSIMATYRILSNEET